MSSYLDIIKAPEDQVNAEFWKNPQGVSVPLDNLRFLYVPDHVQAFITTMLARAVYRYQVDHVASDRQIAKAIMITMGGLLPGVLLHDHLAWNLNKSILPIKFGTLGVKYYAGPGQPLAAPEVIQPLSVDVDGEVVGVVEDLVDLGGTARFVMHYLQQKGAREVLLIAPYLKSRDIMDEMSVIHYGFVPSDTWIITPRERVETLIKRVPYWRDHGATLEQCRANLEAIGYPAYLLDVYLEPAYERGESP